MSYDGDYLHRKYGNYRNFNPEYFRIGVICEREVGVQFGVKIDETFHPDRCPGWDCVLPGVGYCDAKGSPFPGHLLVEEGRAKSDVFILCDYKDGVCRGLLGWAWRKEVLAQPPASSCSCCTPAKEFYLVNHIINRKSLHRMNELHDLVKAARGEVKKAPEPKKHWEEKPQKGQLSLLKGVF